MQPLLPIPIYLEISSWREKTNLSGYKRYLYDQNFIVDLQSNVSQLQERNNTMIFSVNRLRLCCVIQVVCFVIATWSILSPPRTSHRFFGTVLRTGRSSGGGGEGPEYPLPCWWEEFLIKKPTNLEIQEAKTRVNRGINTHAKQRDPITNNSFILILQNLARGKTQR